jgi:hypothetical protein
VKETTNAFHHSNRPSHLTPHWRSIGKTASGGAFNCGQEGRGDAQAPCFVVNIRHHDRVHSPNYEMLNTILIVVLILLLIGALPTWPYSASWGYAPGGALGMVLLVILILALLGRI